MEKKSTSSDWSKVDAVVRKDSDTFRKTEAIVSQTATTPLANAQNIQGVIAKLKANQIHKRAALQAIELATKAQLDVFGHQLQEASRTKKAEATMLAHQFLAQIDAEYQEVLHEIGVRNEGTRRATLKKLSDETASDLAEISNKDWPPFMIESTIKLISERYSKFLARLGEDLEDHQRTSS